MASWHFGIKRTEENWIRAKLKLKKAAQLKKKQRYKLGPINHAGPERAEARQGGTRIVAPEGRILEGAPEE